MNKDDYDRLTFSNYYAGFWGGSAFRWLDHAKTRVLQDVLRDLPGGARILDLGCGSASVSSLLSHRFPLLDILGADADAELLAMAEQKGVRTQQVDFDHPLPFEESAFDVVMMIDTIEHVKSRQSALDEVQRILNPAGTLVIFTPPYDTLAWCLGEKAHRLLTRRMADHISPFTRESLTWCLEERFRESKVLNLNFGLTMCGIGRGKNVKREK